jgi:hypothetical protein
MKTLTIITTKILAILALTLASANSTATEIHLAQKINFISLRAERTGLDINPLSSIKSKYLGTWISKFLLTEP